MSIDRKQLVSGALLAFVAVTGATLAVKETRRVRAVAAAETAEISTPRQTSPAAGTPPSEVSPVVTPAPPAATESRPIRRPPSPRESSGQVPATRPAAPTATVLVTYFHTTARCVSCLKIEDLTASTMTTRFAGPIAEKRVVWRSVNLDEPANNHFVKDYGLFTKSVVVSEVRDGREVRWKNLDQVWHLLGDPDAFQGYVEKEVQAFLEKA